MAMPSAGALALSMPRHLAGIQPLQFQLCISAAGCWTWVVFVLVLVLFTGSLRSILTTST